jgi:hypothetical protein
LSAVFDRLIKIHISLRLGDGSSLGALWELSGSSLGALWELFTVVGIQLFATVDSHTIIAKQKCDHKIWMTGREIFARDNRPTIDLNLMRN